MIRHRLRLAGLAMVSVLLSSTGLVGCADQIGIPAARPSQSTSPDPGDAGTSGPAVQHDLEVEGQLDQIADAIEQDRDGEDIPGYAGLEIDVEASTVTVYWVGEPPQYVRHVVAGSPADILLSLRPASYDLRSMVEAVDKVLDTYGDSLNSASPNTEGDGITVEQTKHDAKHGPSRAELTAAAGMPVTVKIGEPPEAVGG